MSGKRWTWRVVQLVLLVAIGYGVWRSLAGELDGFSWEDLTRYPPQPWPLLVSLALLVGVYIAHAFLWRRIVRDLGIGNPSARSTLRIYFVSSLGRYLPGKLWQLAGLATLSARAGMPALQAGAAAILGQFAFLVAGLLLLAAVLPQSGSGAAVTAAVALGLAAGATYILVATPLGHGIRSRLDRVGGSKLGPRLRATLDLADRIRPRDAIVWFAGYALTWVAIGIAFSLFATAFVPGAFADARQLAATVVASYLAGLVLFTPAGIGVREGAMVTLLNGAASIPAPAAILIAALSRVWFTAAELLPLLLIRVAPDGSAPSIAPAGAGRS